ncbi:MAG: isoprenylcysteine carboxylmethyltransferase family protein [Oligoflexales bacterium]
MSSKANHIGETLFQWRDYTPIPLILFLMFTADPSVLSTTLGMACIGLGELVRIYSVSWIGSVSRTRTRSTGQKLISDGPFGFVRNPLYVGNFCIVAGMAVFSNSLWLIAISLGLFCFQYHYIVKYEENLLSQKFGNEFSSYKTEVPRWLPRKTLKLDYLEWPETFTPALKSEKRTLTAILGVIVLLVWKSL